MTHGVDTDFLVAVEVLEHPSHAAANDLLDHLLQMGHDFALAPQTLAEFIHVVTDGKRMPRPLSVEEAIMRAEAWWHAREVRRIYPDGLAVEDFLAWLRVYRLGRKRLLDTMLAASFHQAGVTKIITNNQGDYRIFGHFDLIGYA